MARKMREQQCLLVVILLAVGRKAGELVTLR
jgi:hypothetical protein